MSAFVRVSALVLTSLALCASAEEARTYGRALTGMKPTPLADLLAKPVDGAAVCLEGTVGKVCQAKGCWLELKQGERSVHVTFEGYAFFVPKDSSGRSVKLEGRVVVKEPKQDEVDHLKREGAGASAAAEVSVEASGVELK